MILSLIPNPLQLCREALNRFENGVNALAAKHLDSPPVVQVLHGATKLTAGTRYLSDKSRTALYRHLALPSRDEVKDIAAAVQRLEDKLSLLLPESAKPLRAAHPARTRQPAVKADQVAPVKKQASKPKRPAQASGVTRALPLPPASPQVQDQLMETSNHVGTA